MSASRRLALPSAALVALGLLSAVLPGRAQQAPSDRFAFADTTLLRDTLDLRFDRLFELADSLRITPDTLRALSIRWGFMPWRLVELADSMRVPVDSVGVVIDRERFNPLAARVERVTDFSYNSSYVLQRTQSTWRNTLDTRLVRGPLFFSQNTLTEFQRLENVRAVTERRRQQTANEIGYRIGRNTSLGARASLTRFISDDPTNINPVNDRNSLYQLSARTQHDPRPGVSAEFNAFGGVTDDDLSFGTKRGTNAEANGRLVLERGTWLQNDWSGRMSGVFALTTPERSGIAQRTQELEKVLRSTLTLWSASPVSLNTDFSYRDARPSQPDENGFITVRPSANTDVTSALRLRGANDRTLNLSGGLRRSKSTVGANNGTTEGRGANLSADARARVLGATVEARFGLDTDRSESPQIDTLGGYASENENRSLEAQITRQFVRQRISTKATGRLSLQRTRYFTIGNYASLPVPRDVASQNYRLETTYTMSSEFNSTAGLEVTRQEQVNLVSSSVGSNTLARSYRANWTWTYRPVQTVTVTQANTMLATYTAYPFNALADRLLLEYATNTTLNAVLTRRFTVDLNHVARVQPSGSYTVEVSDGLTYFRPADETQTYQLSVRASYTPGPILTLSMQPAYVWSKREGTDRGEVVPQSSSANLTFNGSAVLNYPIGHRAKLGGTVTRVFNGARAEAFRAGNLETVTRSTTDNWTANLQFSWKL